MIGGHWEPSASSGAEKIASQAINFRNEREDYECRNDCFWVQHFCCLSHLTQQRHRTWIGTRSRYFTQKVAPNFYI
jgi:hypothetical protein